MNDVGVGMPDGGRSARGTGRSSGHRGGYRGVALAASALMGMTLLAGAAGFASAAPGADRGGDSAWAWSDARWAPDQSLGGGPGATGTALVDWEIDPAAIPGQEFTLRLPDELVALTGPAGTAPEVNLLAETALAEVAPVSATGQWSVDRSTFEVELTDGPGTQELTEPLSGTLELDVTWSEAESLSEGPHKLVLAGPGFSGDNQASLVAVYAAPALDSEPSSAVSTPRASAPAASSPTQVPLEVLKQAQAAAAAVDDEAAETGETGEGAADEAKPKPTKPKPKPTKPKPTPDDDKPGKDKPVSRDEEGGRKKVASVPSGPVGDRVSLPSVGL